MVRRATRNGLERLNSAARLGHAADLLEAPAGSLQLIQVVGVDHRGVAIDLNFGLRKLQLGELTAAFGELRRTLEDRLPILPGVVAGIDGYGLLRDQPFERRPIVREVGPPDGFSRLEQLLLRR